jgi:NTP pyrophosphatase (non-canonical NTP hydrolase)
MNQAELHEAVLQWAKERDLLHNKNSNKQMLKLVEEVGELASAIAKENTPEIVDAIGDIQVVLIILSSQLGIDYNSALNHAYAVIKNRTGKTVNGIFIKSE